MLGARLLSIKEFARQSQRGKVRGLVITSYSIHYTKLYDIVEGRAGDEMEGVDASALAHIPAPRERRRHRAIGAEPGQPLEEIVV